MKKIMLVSLLILAMATPALAGVAGDYPMYIIRSMGKDVDRMETRTCPIIANVATETGLGYAGLKIVTLNQIDSYTKNKLASSLLMKIRYIIRKAAAMCEALL